MKILFIFSNYHLSPITAQPGIAYKLAQKAADEGHEVTILSNTDEEITSTDGAMKLVLFPGLGDLSTYLRSIPLIIKTFFSLKPDVIHIHGNLLLIMIAIINLFFQKPITFFISETIEILTPGQRPIFIWALSQTSHIFVTAEVLKQELIERGIATDQISIAHIGIADHYYNHPVARKEKTDILFFGDSFVERGFDRVEALAAQMPEHSFLILLRWSKPQQLKKIQELPHVQILHYPYTHALEHYIMSSKLVLLPFRFMGVRPPVSILEAMMLGKCVITSTMAGNKEVITDGHDGILDSFEDMAHTKKRITELVKNDAKRQSIGTRARKKMLQLFDQSEYKHVISLLKSQTT